MATWGPLPNTQAAKISSSRDDCIERELDTMVSSFWCLFFFMLSCVAFVAKGVCVASGDRVCFKVG